MRFIGIDVSAKRGCAIAALDDAGHVFDARRVGKDEPEPSLVVATLEELSSGEPLTIGIDAPRKPLTQMRSWRWDRKTERWSRVPPGLRGRHCEVVIRSLGLANPQWTPRYQEAPGWMKLGFELFSTLEPRWTVHEVFPSATYKQLNCKDKPTVWLSFRRFHCAGPKDMLDAVAAAVTVAEYAAKRGAAVGDGDGLGSIVLPCPVEDSELLKWPGDSG